MSRVELEMRGLKRVPDDLLDLLSPQIRAGCDSMVSRTLSYLLVSLFSEIFPVYEIRELNSVSDGMGSLDLNLHLLSGDYYTLVRYSQSILSSFHHVGIDEFAMDTNLPSGISMVFDIDLTTDGRLSLSLHGIGESAAESARELAALTFERVWPAGTADPRIKKVAGEL